MHGQAVLLGVCNESLSTVLQAQWLDHGLGKKGVGVGGMLCMNGLIVKKEGVFVHRYIVFVLCIVVTASLEIRHTTSLCVIRLDYIKFLGTCILAILN